MATLVFSAKEAVYKRLNPLTGVSFGFDDVEVQPDLAAGSFVATVRADPIDQPRRLSGRFRFDGAHVLTGIVVPPRQAGGPASWPARECSGTSDGP